MTRFVTRVLATALITLACAIAVAPAAQADAPGPTDYNTEIISIEPPSSAFDIEIIGGDAFVRLTQLEPIEIIVVGYQGEPYLRFLPNGQVLENRRSPAVWLNQERYGTEDELPDYVDPESPPQWVQVAEGGAFAWHDHRSHWMNPQQPPGAVAGDVILEATVPLDVDGNRVVVTVESTLLSRPSWFPPLVGIVAGLALAALIAKAGRFERAGAALVVGLGALAVGFIAYRSVPGETEPSQLLWLLPLIAVVAALALAAVRNRTATTVYLDGLAVAAGASLLGWGVFRFDALRRALIPSDAPHGLDRIVIAAALVMGAAVLVQGVMGLVRPERLMPIEVSS